MEPENSQLETISRGRWQWKSNQDPWSKSEESKWESYSHKHNYLLEKAYCDRQREVDLGDYIVSLEDMKQTKKTAVPSQRPVRRTNWMENIDEIGRSERYFETEFPKTINKIFGSLGDFIRFFSKRNPEILSFTQKFEQLEKLNDVNGLNKQIIPTLVECLTMNLKSEESTQDLIRLFKKNFISFKEFYGQILKAYTMSSSLYRSLNQYLRNESWIKVDGLLPYAFCLFKVFFYFKKNSDNLNPKSSASSITLYRGTALDEIALSFYDRKVFPNFSWNSATSTSKSKQVAKNFMFGSADIPNKKYPVMFIIEVPIENSEDDLRWIEASPYSAFPKEDEVILAPGSAFELQEVKIDKNKVATIFIKVKNETKSLTSQGLMMQGALQSQMLTDPIMRIMCLEGEELTEALGHIFGNKFIENLEFYVCKFNQSSLKKLMKMLPTIEKVNKLSFFSCSNQDEGNMSTSETKGFENFNIEKLEIFETANLIAIFATETAHSKYWMSLRELKIHFGAMKDDKINHLCWHGLGLLSQLTHLSLNLHQCYGLTNEGVSNLGSDGLKYLTQLTNLYLNLDECSQIKEEGVSNLCSQGLQHLTQLTSLTLLINIYDQDANISDKGLDSLCLNGLRYLTELTSLELNLPRRSGITDQGMNTLSNQGLYHLSQLVSLRISFFTFEKITDEAIKNFFNQGIKCLKKLRSLDLDFVGSHHLTDEGVKNLFCPGLRSLKHLKTLKMKFSYCPQMTDQGVDHLFNDGLVHLSQLEVLSLDFSFVSGTITNGGRNKLLSQSLPLLKSFSLNGQTYLNNLNQSDPHTPKQKIQIQTPSKIVCKRTLKAQNENSSFPFWKFGEGDLHYFSQISKKSWSTSKMPQKAKARFKKVKKWISCNKSNLQRLKSFYQSIPFNLHFSQFESKTSEELQALYFQGLKRFTRPTSLNLDFSHCTQKTDTTLQVLGSQGFQHLTRLTYLQFNFSQDSWHPDQRISTLCSLGLWPLANLKYLYLNFSNCGQLTNKGVKDLCIRGLQHLSELESLSIDFTKGTFWTVQYMTDEGVNSLCFDGLKYLTQLKSLYLNFKDCDQIRGEGLNNLLDYGIENLTQLRSLNLNFSLRPGTFSLMPNSINCLGFQKLTQLTSLSLDFSYRWLMSENGMNNLCSRGLQNLTQLVFLNINFSECIAIYDLEIKTLCSKGLKYLTKLKDLRLNLSSSRVITDQSVNYLCSVIRKDLIQLTSIELNFQECLLITPSTKQNIVRILRFLGFTVSS